MSSANFTHQIEPPQNSHKGKKSAENVESTAQPQHASPDALQRVLTNPGAESLTPDVVQSLQASHGNAFVNGLIRGNTTRIQAKLEVTPANDKYEQEADAMAEQVVQKMNAPVQREAEEEELQMKRIQREGMEEEELQMKRIQREAEEEELQMKRIQREGEEEEPIQMKRIQREGMEEEELQMKRVQREGMEEEELQMKRIQRASSEDGFEVGGEIEQEIYNAKGGGQSLPDSVRGSMEGAFGSDFSDVRVHTGATSETLNRSVQAKAFTHGADIFFGEGSYQPDSSEGQQLLAHELTHVVQQGSAKPLQQKEDKP